eukprot:COSAG02_NODE_4753_length_5022_cov_6.019907_1_plen_219_part_00
MQPLLDVVERIRICYVVNNDDTVRSAVVAAGDCPEALLSSGVPYLQLDGLAIQVDCADFLQAVQQNASALRAETTASQRIRRTHEVHPNGTDVALGVSIIGEPQQQARLAHAGVANQKQLEQVVAARIASASWRARDGQQRVSASQCHAQRTYYSGLSPICDPSRLYSPIFDLPGCRCAAYVVSNAHHLKAHLPSMPCATPASENEATRYRVCTVHAY